MEDLRLSLQTICQIGASHSPELTLTSLTPGPLQSSPALRSCTLHLIVMFVLCLHMQVANSSVCTACVTNMLASYLALCLVRQIPHVLELHISSLANAVTLHCLVAACCPCLPCQLVSHAVHCHVSLDALAGHLCLQIYSQDSELASCLLPHRSSTLKQLAILCLRYRTFQQWLPSARRKASLVSSTTPLPVQLLSGLLTLCHC